ncbi:MAG: beta-galactosidase [Phycisphaerales bacterium]
MTTQNTITYDAKSFIVNGQRLLLTGGEFHYFRTPNELWEDRIIKAKRCGANLITTYIPWSWHEQTEGKQCWSGDRDLGRFIELCQKHGMYMIIKPGPYICAEWDFGGHPDWLLSKKIPIRILNDKYLSYVRLWYKTVAEKISPYLITKGGNILCIQVENEYDHYMNYGEDKVSLDDAVEYFKRLSNMITEFGIDIPQFANEAEFLRGKGIIDTRTYYPNIPFFGNWMYEHEYFDGKIINAKKGQPNCPTMILELQVGWFSQFGQPFYVPPVHLTESVTKSVIVLGASVLNYYMFIGGTTFPYWGCRGNNWPITGIGTGTSFDFGGAMIREWGQVMAGRYDWTKAFMLFCNDFKDLVLESDTCGEFTASTEKSEIQVLTNASASADKTISTKSEKFKVYAKKNSKGEHLVCIRNLSPQSRCVTIEKNAAPIITGLELEAYQTALLPVEVCIPNTEIKIVSSNSELLFAKKIDSRVCFGLYGKTGKDGRTVLNVPESDIKVIKGNVEVGGNNQAALKYKHTGVQLLQIKNNLMFIIEQEMAGKIEPLKNGILICDIYFTKNVEENEKQAVIKFQAANGAKNKFQYFGGKKVANIAINGKPLKFTAEDNNIETSFNYKKNINNAVELKWLSNWKVKADTDETSANFDDSHWQRLAKPISLEEAGLLEHGYIWYRSQFELPARSRDVQIIYKGNATDRQYIYLNGNLIWNGITNNELLKIDVDNKFVLEGTNCFVVMYANVFHNKSHPHEGAILKYSGIMQPVTVNAVVSGTPFTTYLSEFKVRQQLNGILKGYTKDNFDDSDWLQVPAAEKYVVSQQMGNIVWFRRKFEYKCKKNVEAAARLTIPAANQRCVFYLNGKPLGQFESIGPQHEFYIPQTFLKKQNVLAIVLEGTDSFLAEPKLDTFYQAIDAELKIDFEN